MSQIAPPDELNVRGQLSLSQPTWLVAVGRPKHRHPPCLTSDSHEHVHDLGSFEKLPEKIAAAKPHVILVMLGTNDVAWKQPGVSDDHRARAPERLAMHIDRCTSLAPNVSGFKKMAARFYARLGPRLR